MKILCQRDPQWSQSLLGASSLTIGRYGCTTTCLSMLTDYFGKYQSPPEIAGRKEFYAKEGLILWNKLNLGDMQFISRGYGNNKLAIDAAIKNPSLAVILEVNHSHWVVAIGKTIFGQTRIADPWFGDKATLARYQNNVTGYSIFKIK